MKYQSTSTSQGQDILSAYGEAVAAAGRDPKFRQGLAGRERELVPSFDAHYRKLTALPRRMRRAMQRQWKRTLAGVALLMALGAGPAVAATINVDTTAPGVNLLDLRCSLIEAILNANDNLLLGKGSGEPTCEAGSTNLLGASGADTIVLPANSTITLDRSFTNFGNAFGGGPTGLPVITSRITISGNGSTIRRDPADPDMFRIFGVDTNGNLTLQNTKVSGGRTIGNYQSGGGVFNKGTLTLTGSTLSGSSTSGEQAHGGGVYSGGTLTITNFSTLSGNSTSGPFSNGGGVDSVGALTITNSTISGNRTLSYGSEGGGVSVFGGSNHQITNSTISGNSTLDWGSRGGGVSNFLSTLTITNSTISGNSTSGHSSKGGGVVNWTNDHNGHSILTITNSTISGNLTSGQWSDGGGVANYDGDALTITHSTITNNFTQHGAATGGGVFNEGGSLTLTRTLISGNGGNVFVTPHGAEVSSSPSITTNGFNLFGHHFVSTAGALEGVTPGATDITATSDGTRPTVLSSIRSNTLGAGGGTTRTHSISFSSPALDAVTTGCPPPAADQRGFLRPRDGDGDGFAFCDIGSFEK